MTRARIRLATVLVLAALAVTACAAGPNPDIAHTAGHAGFWLGLWQGFITPVTFVISLFTDHVNIYEVHNTGNWYDFGYVLGLTTSLGGSAGSGRAATRGRTYPARRKGR